MSLGLVVELFITKKLSRMHPSNADMKITQKLKEGSKLLDIEVCDHIIVITDIYYCFADECMV
ncbi:JAB domain-containing protein [Pedobacter aquatilis]|uniref:JAB domain-containing protein n=1 Tax=Pedobacter aquatilis TaxID=351343 RepID=UPI003977B6EA